MNARLFVFLALAPCFALASSLPTLKYRALDSSGNPLSGAKLYFYTTGTTTPLATYSDEALSSANANPVVADSYGWFGIIYLKTDSTYRVVLKTSADVTQWTLDGIKATQLADSSLSDLLNQVASAPTTYGAVGDGATDDSTAVQAAITAAASGGRGGVVDLLGLVYKCDSAITVPSGVTIKNGTLDFSACVASYAVTLEGTVAESNVVTGNIAAGATTYDITSATGLSAGDWQILSDYQTYITGVQPKELLQIKSISSLTVTPTHPVDWAYTTANGAHTFDLEMVTGVVFDSVTFLHSATATSKSIVDLLYASDVVFKNCTFDGASLYALSLRSAADVTIDNCEFSDNKSSAGIGIYIREASRDIRIINSRFTEDSLYGIYLAGKPVRNILIENSTFAGPTYGIMFGKSSTDVKINKCSFFGDTAIYASSGGAANLSITNSTFTNTNSVSLTDWWLPSGDWDFVFSNNSSISEASKSVAVASSANNTGDINFKINNNNIELGDIRVSWSTGTGVINNFTAANNNLFSGDLLLSGDGNPAIGSCSAIGNTIVGGTSLTGAAITLYGCSKIVANNNTITGTGGTTDKGIDMAAYGNSCTASNNIISGIIAGYAGIYAQECGKATISNNVISSAYTGIFLTNASYETQATISNNVITAADSEGIGLNLVDATGSKFSITGNNIVCAGTDAVDYVINVYGYASNSVISNNHLERASDTGRNIVLGGVGAGSITKLNITGNVFVNGDYAIGEITDGYSTSIFASGNYLDSIGTSLNEYNIYEGENRPDSRSTYYAWWAEADATAEVMLLQNVETETDAIAFTEIYDSGDVFDDSNEYFDVHSFGYYHTQYDLIIGVTATDINGDITLESWIDLDGSTEHCGYAVSPSTAVGTSAKFISLSGGCVFNSTLTQTGTLYVKGTWDDGDPMASDDCTVSISANVSYWSGHAISNHDD